MYVEICKVDLVAHRSFDAIVDQCKSAGWQVGKTDFNSVHLMWYGFSLWEFIVIVNWL